MANFVDKMFVDDNFKFDENGRECSKRLEKTLGKGKLMSNFSFSHSVFKRLVLQTHKNKGMFSKGLSLYHKMRAFDPSVEKAFDRFSILSFSGNIFYYIQ